MQTSVIIAILGLIAYFIGNISPSIIMAKRAGLDIKKEGSGNAGTTNALRVMGKKAGAITMVVDILKGAVAVIIGFVFAGSMGAACCALFVFLGHVWPMIYRFKGGKGVATTFGVLLAVNLLYAGVMLGIVAIFVLITKRMSVGSIVGSATLPVVAFFMEPEFLWVALIMAVVLLVKHRTNMGRLIRGEEPIMSIFEKKKKEEIQEEDV
ncbi:MAG: glycerol-3-phosphate 1-O-acyltransferase PlsY [Lentihominibacter sp.]|jgi:glycerol-3-phosphate acyltransferase PlsY